MCLFLDAEFYRVDSRNLKLNKDLLLTLINVLKLPKEGVVPPSNGFSQNSILSAPALIASTAASTEKTAISRIGVDIINKYL